MTFGGVCVGVLVNFGAFDKIVANALRCKAGSEGRSLVTFQLPKYYLSKTKNYNLGQQI